MIQKNLLLMLLTMFSVNAHSQLLTHLCTADARSSLSIQQVDYDWNPIPFDCENIEVSIENEIYHKEIKPGKFEYCPKLRYQNTEFVERMKGPVYVMFENPGTYQVTVSRFEEISIFKEVLIPVGESGCHTIPQFLEVQFDMTQKAK